MKVGRRAWARLLFLLGAWIPQLALLPGVASAEPQRELRELYRGARAIAMGNAFVAIADDESAIYYNPAGLAAIDSSWFQYIGLDLEASHDAVTSTSTSLSAVKDISGDTVNQLMGKNIYGRASFTPTYMAPNFGFGVLVDQQVAVRADNKAMPNVTVGFQTTNGIQLGYGFSLGRKRRTRGELRLGVGAKVLFRRGGYYDMTQEQVINLSQDTFKQMVGSFGVGFGWDLGAQYVLRMNNRTTLTFGGAFTEIGGVEFSGDTAQEQPQNLSVGTAFKYRFNKFDTTLAYDYRHITQSIDMRMRNHIGFKLGVPVFDFYLGVNQVYPTFGVTANLRILSLTAVSYAEETSSMAKISPERRYLLSLSMGL